MKYLYFSAKWCQPCKTLSPIMNEVSSHIEVEKIDVDLDYEKPIAEVNKSLNEDLETIFFVTKPEYSSISSTIIRELYKYNKAVDRFIPFEL